MVKISIIIPVYNTEFTILKRCIDSIIKQPFSDFEILLIDDGSSPEYSNKYNLLSSVDPRIVVFHKSNGGASSARNFGLNYAKGKYISYVDADDMILPNYLEEAYSIAETYNVPFVIGGNIIGRINDKWAQDNIKMDISKLTDDKKELLVCNIVHNLIRFDKDCYIGRGPVSRLVEQKFAKIIHFDESLTFAEDICWNIDLIRSVSSLCVVKRAWYNNIPSNISVTSKFSPDLIHNTAIGINAVHERINYHVSEQYSAYIGRVCEEIKRIYRIYKLSDCRINAFEFWKILYKDELWKNVLRTISFSPKIDIPTIIKIFMLKTRAIVIYCQVFG